MKKTVLFLFVLILFGLPCFITVSSDAANNWAHWRGPLMNGSSPDANPPLKWDENTNILWKKDIHGEGSATPIVWGNRIFVVTAIQTDKQKEGVETQAEQTPPQDQERGRRGGRRGFGGGGAPTHYYHFDVICLDLQSGEEIWRDTAIETVPHAGHHQTGSYAAGSPVSDGESLFVTFGSYGIYRYDLEGKKIWEKDLGDMRTRNSFGEGTSLTVHDDLLIVNWDHEDDSFIAALDKKSGDIVWKKSRDERTTWSTPVVYEHDGQKQIIVNGSNRVVSYDLGNGDVIWQCGGQTDNPIPTPIRYEDTVLCTSGFRGAALYAIPLSAKGDISNSDTIRWTHNSNTPYVPSPVLYEDYLYFMKGNDATLTCVNAKDGSVVYGPVRLDVRGGVYASLGAASGYIYISTREGDTAVLKHGDELEIVSVNSLGQTIDASPVFIDNKLLLRGSRTLFCIAEK